MDKFVPCISNPSPGISRQVWEGPSHGYGTDQKELVETCIILQLACGQNLVTSTSFAGWRMSNRWAQNCNREIIPRFMIKVVDSGRGTKLESLWQSNPFRIPKQDSSQNLGWTVITANASSVLPHLSPAHNHSVHLRLPLLYHDQGLPVLLSLESWNFLYFFLHHENLLSEGLAGGKKNKS